MAVGLLDSDLDWDPDFHQQMEPSSPSTSAIASPQGYFGPSTTPTTNQTIDHLLHRLHEDHVAAPLQPGSIDEYLLGLAVEGLRGLPGFSSSSAPDC
jgi:hypothetical protein